MHETPFFEKRQNTRIQEKKSVTAAQAVSSASRTPGVPVQTGTSQQGNLESLALGRGRTRGRTAIRFQGLTLALDQLRLLGRRAGRDRITLAIAPLAKAKFTVISRPLGRR